MKAGIPSVDEVFEQAIRHAPGPDRSAFLDEACGTNVDLRQRVDRLLKALADAGSFLETPAVPVEPTIELPVTERPGTIIGPYKLLQQIGEGGMGIVFMAEQTQPVQRKIALKIIKPGMDNRQVIARFEAERQALAMMDHVNIARVIDGGTTESGRPYFVMELINGIPITKYCDDNHLTPRERLELFIPVCQAVQHAHQKGIIHRDIKPSNVLITLYDGKPVPKVIDFGVAKAIDQKLTDNTLFTNFGTMVGTLEYMSPEQAEINNLGVDTRSDIYSLGVLLYELLTGSTPLTRQRLKEAANLEILRMIKEEEPQKPSTRLSESGDKLASISAQRNMEPGKLSKLLRGELDWIVMKTLEKDRDRRYETANGLAVDVQRYLADEPVQACPPSVGYRVRKFVRRNKGAVLGAALIFFSLIGGIIGTSWGLFEASRQRDAAFVAADAEKKAKENAVKSEAEIKAVINFVEKRILAAARIKDEEGGLGYDVKLVDAIKAALPMVARDFANQPRIEANLRMTIGLTFSQLGDWKNSAEQYEAARALYSRLVGPDHPDTLNAMNNLGVLLRQLGKPDDARKLHEETLKLMKNKLGHDNTETLGCMVNLSNDLLSMGRRSDAARLLESALKVMKVKLPDHPWTFNCMTNLAECYRTIGRNAESNELLETILSLRMAKLGPTHTETLRSMNILANSYARHGQHDRAVKLLNESLAQYKAKLPSDHPLLLNCMKNIALNYAAIGLPEEALKLYQEVLETEKTTLSFDHPETLGTMHEIARCYLKLFRPNDAIKWNERTVELRKIRLGVTHPDTLGTMENLAICYDLVRRYDAAELVFRDSLKIREQTDPNGFYTFRTKSMLGGILLKQKQYDKAESLLLAGYKGMEQYESKITTPQDKLFLTQGREQLVKYYEATGNKVKADEWRKKMLSTKSTNSTETKKN